MDVPRTAPRRTNRRVLFAGLILLLLLGTTLGLRRLRGAAPTVERSAVWIDTVQRGPMVREVQGPGTLVPEEIHWITAVAPARVVRLVLRPGAVVTADSILAELSNPDLELQALEADRQLGAGQADLVNEQAVQQAQRLSQESAAATLRSQLGDARRRAAADGDLFRRGFLAELEMAQSRDLAAELAGRLGFEERRLSALGQGISAQLAARRAQLERLRAIAEFRHREVDGLKVRAGIAAVLQDLPLHPGQSVATGTLLAKVARPDRLKAEIRVPETLAKDVQIGLSAAVDTRNGVIAGKVAQIDPAVQGGTVRVEVALVGALPPGARPDLSIEATIEIERLAEVLYVGRPAFGQPHTTISLFRLDPDGEGAGRARVQLGRASTRTIEIRGGLREGDRIVLSDLSQVDTAERIRLR